MFPKGPDMLDKAAVVVSQVIPSFISCRRTVRTGILYDEFCLIISVLAVCRGLLVVVSQDDIGSSHGKSQSIVFPGVKRGAFVQQILTRGVPGVWGCLVAMRSMKARPSVRWFRMRSRSALLFGLLFCPAGCLCCIVAAGDGGQVLGGCMPFGQGCKLSQAGGKKGFSAGDIFSEAVMLAEPSLGRSKPARSRSRYLGSSRVAALRAAARI